VYLFLKLKYHCVHVMFQMTVEQLQSTAEELFSKVKAFTCGVCNEVFRRKGNVVEHCQLEHTDTESASVSFKFKVCETRAGTN